MQTYVWPVVISGEWEGENGTEKISEDSDITIQLRVTDRKAYLKDDKA